MGKGRKLFICSIVAIISLMSLVACSSKENSEAENIILEIAPTVEQKEEQKYLSLDEDLNADDASELQERLNYWDFISEDGKKVAYLTFDDGPSENTTEAILDVLDKNNVKATFFVLGSMIEKTHGGKELLKRMVDDGHAIGNHGYSHVYDLIYPAGTVSVDNFMADMNKSLEVMKSVLGEDFHTRVIRFPGGHSAWYTDEIDLYLADNNYTYIDWNTFTGDAESSRPLSTEVLVDTLKETVNDIEGNNDVIVVLMHDTDGNENKIQSLQYTIDYLSELGYEFRTMK